MIVAPIAWRAGHDGTAHAVRGSSSRALCGVTAVLESLTWPETARCRTCLVLADDRPERPSVDTITTTATRPSPAPASEGTRPARLSADGWPRSTMRAVAPASRSRADRRGAGREAMTGGGADPAAIEVAPRRTGSSLRARTASTPVAGPAGETMTAEPATDP